MELIGALRGSITCTSASISNTHSRFLDAVLYRAGTAPTMSPRAARSFQRPLAAVVALLLLLCLLPSLVTAQYTASSCYNLYDCESCRPSYASNYNLACQWCGDGRDYYSSGSCVPLGFAGYADYSNCPLSDKQGRT